MRKIRSFKTFPHVAGHLKFGKHVPHYLSHKMDCIYHQHGKRVSIPNAVQPPKINFSANEDKSCKDEKFVNFLSLYI